MYFSRCLARLLALPRRSRSLLAAGLVMMLTCTSAVRSQQVEVKQGDVKQGDVKQTFRDRDGQTRSLSDLRGHPAVVNFWATWCGPCKEEMPRLQKIADSYKAQGVQFVAISLDAQETQGKIASVVARRDFRLPVWTGATDATLNQLGLGVLVPATIILDETGQPIGKIEGEARDKDIRTRLDWLLSGKPGKQPRLVQKNDW